jgi:hypothetical protein
MRILGMLKADKESEADTPPSADLMERMGAFVEEATKAGVLVGGDGLHPTAKGKRVRLERDKFTIIDGPFTEAKELIASYALFDVKSMDEAVEWTRRFLDVLGKGECELRPIIEAEDFSEVIFPPEARAREEATRKEMEKNAARKK